MEFIVWTALETSEASCTKKTVNQLQELGAADDQGNVDIDTGAVILDSDILKSLYSLIDTDEKIFSLCK
mgnify:CR=1 FL=1